NGAAESRAAPGGSSRQSGRPEPGSSAVSAPAPTSTYGPRASANAARGAPSGSRRAQSRRPVRTDTASSSPPRARSTAPGSAAAAPVQPPARGQADVLLEHAPEPEPPQPPRPERPLRHRPPRRRPGVRRGAALACAVTLGELLELREPLGGRGLELRDVRVLR